MAVLVPFLLGVAPLRRRSWVQERQAGAVFSLLADTTTGAGYGSVADYRPNPHPWQAIAALRALVVRARAGSDIQRWKWPNVGDHNDDLMPGLTGDHGPSRRTVSRCLWPEHHPGA